MRERAPERQTSERGTRVPLGQRNLLTVEEGVIPPGMVGRWINDVTDRVAKALKGGYQFVMSDKTVGDVRCAHPSKLGAYVTQSAGQGVTAFLMAIPKEWYEEDQSIKREKVAASEKAVSPQGIAPQHIIGAGVTSD